MIDQSNKNVLYQVHIKFESIYLCSDTLHLYKYIEHSPDKELIMFPTRKYWYSYFSSKDLFWVLMRSTLPFFHENILWILSRSTTKCVSVVRQEKYQYFLVEKMCLNLYHSLGIFSRRQIDDIFLIFPRKQDLTFHANCLLRRQFAWNVKSCFLGKIRKIFQNVVCWNFYLEC